MTGDAPQPGETPRDDGTPWSHADPASPWWPAERQEAAGRTRGATTTAATTPSAGAPSPGGLSTAGPTAAATPGPDRPRATRHAGEAARAHRAGEEDVAAALTGAAKQEPAAEHDHDRVDAERFNTEGKGTVYATRAGTRPPGEPEPTAGAGTGVPEPTVAAGTGVPEPTVAASTGVPGPTVAARTGLTRDPEPSVPARTRPAGKPDPATPAPPEPAHPEPTPDVMVLPDPDPSRPTVALDRTPVPGRQASPLSRLGRAREDSARADRALQDRVRQERTAALLETSPFWKAEEERRAASALAGETRELPAPVRRRARRRAPEPRRPAAGLLGLLALGLIAAFFAWVSAEPFWLAVGHGDRGYATVSRCTGSGVTQRCVGQFVAADDAYQVDRLALFGVEPAQSSPGASSPARMVSSESRQAYVGSTGVLVHLRWALSFVLVLLCGLGIAVLTGARRLETVRARRGALLLSMAGPLALLAGFLSVTY